MAYPSNNYDEKRLVQDSSSSKDGFQCNGLYRLYSDRYHKWTRSRFPSPNFRVKQKEWWGGADYSNSPRDFQPWLILALSVVLRSKASERSVAPSDYKNYSGFHTVTPQRSVSHHCNPISLPPISFPPDSINCENCSGFAPSHRRSQSAIIVILGTVLLESRLRRADHPMP